ncbi:MAG: hypothetical protein Q9222_007277 [Ikaeria aurantiellina]
MLPMPGSPSSTWAMFLSRLKTSFSGADFRVCTAFWLFGLSPLNFPLFTLSGLRMKPHSQVPSTGLINNVLYVIILSAALDLVGPTVPKSIVLLADVIPSFLIKLVAPYFIHVIPYSLRTILFSLLSAWGMLLIALSPPYTDGGTITTKMAGVVLASLSSGAGELSFLGLTHYYGPFSLAAWGSGTGAAGLVGAGAYSIATTTIGFSIKASLLASSLLPMLMILGFFVVLPRGPLRQRHQPKSRSEDMGDEDPNEDRLNREDEGLLSGPGYSNTENADSETKKNQVSWRTNFVRNLRRSRGLFFP